MRFILGRCAAETFQNGKSLRPTSEMHCSYAIDCFNVEPRSLWVARTSWGRHQENFTSRQHHRRVEKAIMVEVKSTILYEATCFQTRKFSDRQLAVDSENAAHAEPTRRLHIPAPYRKIVRIHQPQTDSPVAQW